MKLSRPIVFTGIIIVLLLAALACNAQRATPTEDLGIVVAQTQTSLALDSLLTATGGAQQAPPAITPPPQAPSAAPTTSSPPPAETSLPDCDDKAKFEGETIPDNKAFPPGEQFVKTWTLRNVGTCTWTPDYALVFVEGDPMGGTSPSPIGETITPGNTIQLFLPQTAPPVPGNHEGLWKLRNTRGQDFGLGKDADVAFWVKIAVEEDASEGGSTGELNLGPPTWVDTFDGPSGTFDLGSDSNTKYEIKNGNLIVTATVPNGDLWRITMTYLDDFYLQARFRTGGNCSGSDSYGLIVRAPDQPDSIIDTGYVFGFSCEGKYRIYRMDDGAYNGIVNWTNHPSVIPGTDQNNDMGIKAEGNVLQLYANGSLVYELNDSTYPGGLFGLMVRSDTTPNFQVLVKEIAYWKYVP